MTTEQLDIIVDKLIAINTTHREIANEHVHNTSVWTARMAAVHVNQGLLEIAIALRLSLRDEYEGK